LFADLNFRGDLDLVALTANREVRVMSNLKNMYFVDTSTNVPVSKAAQIACDDWNNDETQDLLLSESGKAPTLLLKQRAGAWSNAAVNLPAGEVLTVGDFNNDMRPDVAVIVGTQLHVALQGGTPRVVDLAGFQTAALRQLDFDNDGWVDLVALGATEGLRVLRNVGPDGFKDVTAALGLSAVRGKVTSFVAADLDGDCDSDIVLSTSEGVHFLRNDGGNSNHQLRVTLQGTRSNPSGIGIRVDAIAGGLRTARRVRELPVEIGVGKHRQLDAVNVHWSELSPSYTEIDLTNCAPLPVLELAVPTGSCPYLYTWDGTQTRFVADFLCSAPLGLPVAPGVYIEADEDELLWLGNESNVKPRPSRSGQGAALVLHMTEELREVLYLDEAKLVVVDHPPGTEVHSTERMLPRRPAGGFPKDEIITLHNRLPVKSAVNDQGVDVTRAVAEIDRTFASPSRLRETQLRGLAESHSVTVDFGPLPMDKPLVLALTGWLRFGGGMANIAASSQRDFPFPFPTLEVEANGRWQPVDVQVGAPSGRAKTVVVDLAKKLPAGAHRLRVTAAFEIHWDRIALFERAGEAATRVTSVSPTTTDLHRRGYGELSTLPGTQLLVPSYDRTQLNPLWRLTPSGWATRYGAVDELIRERDNALAMICAGDELTVEFATSVLPPKPAGTERDYFVFVSGWDKDSDFHVQSGPTIEPLPWHGLNDQTYGTGPRPGFTNDTWMEKFNTRWVGPRILSHR
jgi:hypothetical protein